MFESCFRMLHAGALWLVLGASSSNAAERIRIAEAETATRPGGARVVVDEEASGRASVALNESTQAIQFCDLPALRAGGATLRRVSKVESDVACSFVQDEHRLTVTPADRVPPRPDIADATLASSCRVLRITPDKGWFNVVRP